MILITVIQPYFVGEVECEHLNSISSSHVIGELREVLHENPVLVFRNKPLTDEDQIRFAECLSGQRGHCFFSRLTNLDDGNQPLQPNDFRRIYSLSTRLWHTDGSCNHIPSGYSMLSAKSVPRSGGQTDFADMRAAYDSLSDEMKDEIEIMQAEHARAYSRHLLSSEPNEASLETIGGVVHPLVYRDTVTKRRSLYLSSNATKILNLPLADGRLLLRDLIEHATQPQFVYRHHWHVDDFVIWNNRVTMHRMRRYDDQNDVRDLRRVTTPDASPRA